MKNKRLIAIVLLFTLAFSATSVYAQDPIDGSIKGFEDGYLYVLQNFSYGADIPIHPIFPSEISIYNKYRTEIDKLTETNKKHFYEEYASGYLAGYTEARALLVTPDAEQPDVDVNYAASLGESMGEMYGYRDFYNNLNSSWSRAIPTNSKIISMFNLERETSLYRSAFLSEFREKFQEGYNDAFEFALLENTDKIIASAASNGNDLGYAMGKTNGEKDVFEGKSNNYKRDLPSDSSIINEYQLNKALADYKTGFVNGFKLGYEDGYYEAYHVYLIDRAEYEIVPISGGSFISSDYALEVKILSGTFYNDVRLKIEKIFNSKYGVNKSRYIEASDIYNVQLDNSSSNLNNSKPITISMEYYGKYDGGIYKWVNGKWSYILSEVKDGMIVAEINPNTLRKGDNLYCILIDKDYKILADARGIWANKEIDISIRRDIIKGYPDNSFKPDRNISRGEFLTLLSRTYSWRLPSDTANIRVFKDYSSFNYMEKVISYAISRGYIYGYEDNTFRPNQNISYREIELIMARLSNDSSFKWYNVSDKMMYEKQYRSRSYNNMNNKITRAEVAYMLNILNEWKY